MAVPPGDTLALEGHEAANAGGTETARLTGPERPERLVRVTVPFPVGAVNEICGAETLKSIIVTGRMIEWLSEPLVAVKVTV